MPSPLSQTAVCAQVRDLVAQVTAMEHVYAASENDENSIPNVIQDFPAAIVFPGGDVGDGYEIGNNWHEHTYEVIVQIMQGGPEPGERVATVLPFVNRIIELFTGNVTLGGRVAYCFFSHQSGLAKLDYGGEEYDGYVIVLEVQESAAATPAVGV